MEIVVQSKGKGLSRGYKWLNQKNEKTDPPNQISDYLDTEDSSLILVRAKEKLILAITGLKSSRSDNRTRTIRNSVIWTAENSQENNQLHSLVIQYLENPEKIREKIDPAITFESENGFKFEPETLKKVVNNAPSFSPPNSPDNTNKIGNLTNCKPKLINDLKNYQLPERDGLLIFTSEIKSQKSFEELKPWRGLSSQINSNDWIILGGDKEMTTTEKIQEELKKSSKSSNFFTILVTSLVTSLITVIIGYGIYTFFIEPNLKDEIRKEFQENTSKLKDELIAADKQLKKDIESINITLKDLPQDIEEVQKKIDKLQETFNNIKADLNKIPELTSKVDNLVNPK